ncbi:MAG: T9SS type A sorting domain-containing protein [Bacteroidota bacterium]
MKTILIILCLAAQISNAQTIRTIAGNGTPGFSGDGGPAVSAELKGANFIVFDKHDNMFVCDAGNRRIRKVDNAGIITTIAGNGTNAHTGDGGLATLASLHNPTSIAVDTFGNIYIGESAGHTIRKINTSGIITTIAGDGTIGYNGDGILATTAKLFFPYLGKVDNSGNIFFGDYGNHRVRKIDATGIITTVAGDGTNGSSGDGGSALSAKLKTPVFVNLNSAGDIFIPDNSDFRVRKVDASTGIITTFAGNGVMGNTGDGGAATSAQISFVNSMAFDHLGNSFLADLDANVIRKVNSAGIISTIAGTGATGYGGDNGPAINAVFNSPNSIAVNSAGNVAVADVNNNRIRLIIYNNTAVANQEGHLLKVSVFPNPAKDNIVIDAEVPIETLDVINVVGTCVTEVRPSLGDRVVTVDVSRLPAALYVIKVNGVIAGKFVKE